MIHVRADQEQWWEWVQERKRGVGMGTASTDHLLESFFCRRKQRIKEAAREDQGSRFIFFFFSFLFVVEVEERISYPHSFHNTLSTLPCRSSLHFHADEKL